jgi:hypothetical protein
MSEESWGSWRLNKGSMRLTFSYSRSINKYRIKLTIKS